MSTPAFRRMSANEERMQVALRLLDLTEKFDPQSRLLAKAIELASQIIDADEDEQQSEEERLRNARHNAYTDRLIVAQRRIMAIRASRSA